MYAVAGVTGNTGSVVARHLLDGGERVRVIVREAAKGEVWAARGAEIAVASLDDAPALTDALRGVSGAYLLVPPDVTAADYLASRNKVVDAIATALEAARVPRAVLLSSIAAHQQSGIGPIASARYLEQRVGKREGVVFLRASYFLENWASVLPSVLGDGVLPTFFGPGRPEEMVSVLDIGAVAAELLRRSSSATPVVELSGPQKYSPEDIGRIFSSLLNKPIAVVKAPNEAIVPTFTSFGMGESLARLYTEMLGSLDRGAIEFEGQGPLRRGITTAEAALARLLAPARD